MAADVLKEAMQSCFGGAMIGTLPKGLSGNLDDGALDPFWQAASDLKAGLFLHPMFLCGEPRLADYDLVNAIGRVADTSIAVARHADLIPAGAFTDLTQRTALVARLLAGYIVYLDRQITDQETAPPRGSRTATAPASTDVARASPPSS